MQQVSNPFSAMKEIVTRPNRVFATINDIHNWSWLPFIIIAVVSALPLYIYFNFVDFTWYNDLIVQSVTGDLSPAEQSAVRNAMPDQAQSVWTGVFGTVFGLIIGNALLALYLNIVTKSDEECVQGYTDWYGFTWWVSIPTIISSLLAVVIVLFASDPQLSPISLAPTSLAFIFSVEMSSPWSALMQAIRLETVWVIYLITVGLSQWTQLPAKKNYTIAIAPYAIIWGVWALINLL